MPAAESLLAWIKFAWKAAWAVAVLLACLPTWLAFTARWSWWGELSTHFVLPYCLVLPVALIACWRLRWKRLGLLTVLTLLINVGRVATLYAPAPRATPDRPVLRVLTQNVFKQNKRHDEVIRLIRREDPDLFLLSEVNQRWVDAMRPLEDAYPHRSSQLLRTRSGLLIASKRPFESVRFEKLSEIDRFCAVATIGFDGRSVMIVGMHAPLPRRPKNVAWRNNELMAAARLVAEAPEPAILMGDLNTTPWSPIFGEVLRAGGLRNSMQGFGPVPTWGYARRWPLTLPIDHVLHTPGLVVADRRVGPFVGSDHRAVTVDFALQSGESDRSGPEE